MLKTTRSYIEALTTGLANESGIKFIESQNWQADIKHRKLYFNSRDLQEMPAGVAKGVILHETGHLKHTKVQGETELQKKNPAMQSVYNAFEDLRMERELNDEYGDFSKEPLAQLNYYGTSMIAEAVKSGKADEKTKLDRILTGVIVAANAGKVDYKRFTDSSYRELAQKTVCDMGHEIFSKVYDIYHGEPLIRIVNAGTTDELKKIVDEEIYPTLKEYIEEANNKPPEPTIEQQVIRGHGAGAKMHEPRDDMYIPQDNELETLLSMQATTLSAKIKNILKEDSTIRYTGNYLQGKMLSKNTYKVLTGDYRVFSRRNRPEKPEYAVMMVLDDSGSMHGKSHTNTYIGAYLLKMACRALNFPVTYIKYNEDADLISDLSEYRTHRGGDNDDYQACKLAYDNLDKAKHNIIFFLTDGGVCHDPTEIVQKINREHIPFFAIGVGLTESETDQLAEYYVNPISVPEVEDIPQVLVGLMGKVIHR